MIFITLGSQKFQFDRLLKAVDDLVERGVITEDVFAQSGYSTYVPQHYPIKPFLNREEFAEKQEQADIVITHGGTGAIIGAVKKGKKVIAVPRLAKYGEHVDDHQLQLVGQFKSQNLICDVQNCEELESALRYVQTAEFQAYTSNTETIINDIESFLRSMEGDL